MRFQLGWGPARCCRYRSSAWRGETPLNMKLCCKTEKKYGLAVLHAKNDGVEEDGLAINMSGVFLDFKTPSTTKQVLQGVNLGIPRGRFHMLLGPNGCGKSTLLRILAGLLKADSGSFSVTPPYGFVFQNPDHQVVMPTVSADVAFGLGRYNLEEGVVRAAVAHALRQVGLADLAERPVNSLSGGQKQRVAIAGALAESPQVLLMDELTTFLDYEDQLNVLRCVRSIVDGEAFREPSPGTPSASTSGGGSGSGAASTGGVTALWVTHRLEELEYADYVSYMDGGRIVFSGTPAEMRSFLRSLGAVL